MLFDLILPCLGFDGKPFSQKRKTGDWTNVRLLRVIDVIYDFYVAREAMIMYNSNC